MNGQDGGNNLKNVEYHAEELVALTFELCERRLASVRAPLGAPQKALSAAAMCVQQSVETFLHVSQIPDQTAKE